MKYIFILISFSFAGNVVSRFQQTPPSRVNGANVAVSEISNDFNEGTEIDNDSNDVNEGSEIDEDLTVTRNTAPSEQQLSESMIRMITSDSI